jgi:two-component system LytT family sensor kinase
MELSRLLGKDRMVVVGVHASILTLLLLIALFLNATVRGPSILPNDFYKSQYTFNLLTNLCFFYLVYGYLKGTYKKINTFSRIIGLFFLLIIAVIFSVTIDLSVVDLAFSLNDRLARYFIVINTVSKTFYMVSAILVIALVNLLIQKRHYTQLRLATAEAELAIIKNQTNPHFLFNVLNTLYASAYKFGDYTTANGIGQMASLMRYTLHSNQQEYVTLAQEIEYIEQFIHLQKLRFGKNLSINFQYQHVDENKKISPMLLMPLIENAFKYGIFPGANSHISVALETDDNEVSCQVINPDSSQQVKASEHFNESGTGIHNLEQRLELLYPKKFTLHNERNSGTYTARLTIKCC